MLYTTSMTSRNRAAAVLVVAFVGIAFITVSACTSFATFGERTLYGMNFDAEASPIVT